MSLKIVAISDTHSYHRRINIPDADVIVCAGDISFRGELTILKDFADWMGSLPIKHKITIFGNHEVGMSIEGHKNRNAALQFLKDNNIHYLQDSGVEIEGVKFWGSPVQPRFFNWEWNRDRGKDIDKHWKKIPLDTNVLITHGPPFEILDLVEDAMGRNPHQGCEMLALRLKDLTQLKAHVFGHLHHNGGESTTIDNVFYGNASICTDQYQPINPPIVFEV